MAIQGKEWCQIALKNSPKGLVSLVLVPMGMGLVISKVEGRPPLSPVCVGIAPVRPEKSSPQSSPQSLQRQCCHPSAKVKCLKWQQLFPEADRPQSPQFKRPSPTAAELFPPKLDEFGNSVRSQGAAKDAVIQVGVTKALDTLGPKLNLDESSSKQGRRLNFFQRIRRDYERILGPRELKSGAILTPQVGMGMDLGRFNVDSMNLGVQIKF
jgi:hypothetical protein